MQNEAAIHCYGAADNCRISKESNAAASKSALPHNSKLVSYERNKDHIYEDVGLLQHDGSNARLTNQTDVIVFCTSLLRKGK